MAEGRWLDDAYGGMPRASSTWPHPRTDRYIKYTWPAAIVIGLVLTGVTPIYGWVIGVAVWGASCWVPWRREWRQYNAEKAGHPKVTRQVPASAVAVNRKVRGKTR